MERTKQLFQELANNNYRKTSRVFIWLMVAQWVAAVFAALVLSPSAWEGKVQSVHIHVLAAFFLGGALSVGPIAMAYLRPEATSTRFLLAVSQMLWSALLIHLTGGRIETHFHVFASLAFVSFYRDWRLLVVATVVVAADHLVRGLLWPESVYGIFNPEWWRFLEHAFWVVVENVVLVLACLRGVQEMRDNASRQAQLEESHDALTRSEKLAAVGQLAASVGHDLRNPLTAVRNGLAYVQKRAQSPELFLKDARVPEFLSLMDKELRECARIISNLLDFARERAPERRPCPLGPLVKEAISLVPPREHVTVVNEVSDELPIPLLDKDQFRQAVINLVQNASEAIPTDRPGEVRVTAKGGGDQAWLIEVKDNGQGIAPENLTKIFQPLFTTKTKGTGLGLAIVAGLVQKQGGRIDVRSEVGKGTSFIIELA